MIISAGLFVHLARSEQARGDHLRLTPFAKLFDGGNDAPGANIFNSVVLPHIGRL
jgi:hypothetical protein